MEIAFAKLAVKYVVNLLQSFVIYWLSFTLHVYNQCPPISIAHIHKRQKNKLTQIDVHRRTQEFIIGGF